MVDAALGRLPEQRAQREQTQASNPRFRPPAPLPPATDDVIVHVGGTANIRVTPITHNGPKNLEEKVHVVYNNLHLIGTVNEIQEMLGMVGLAVHGVREEVLWAKSNGALGKDWSKAGTFKEEEEADKYGYWGRSLA